MSYTIKKIKRFCHFSKLFSLIHFNIFPILFRFQGGISRICRDINFGDNVDVRLSREHKGSHGVSVYAINTDFHVRLEFQTWDTDDASVRTFILHQCKRKHQEPSELECILLHK